MRNTLFIMIGLMLMVKGFSQAYHPIPTDSVYWVEQEHGLAGMTCYFTTYKCIYPVGDVIIEGNTYTEYRYNSITNHFPIPGPFPSCPADFSQTNMLYTFLRNDTVTQRVYAYDSLGNHEEVMIYDFSVNIGDTIYPVSLFNGALYSCPYDTFLVSAIYNIDLGVDVRKKICLNKTMNTSDTTYLIEGVGSNFGLAYSVYCPFEAETHLICFENNGLQYPPPSMGSNPYCSRSLSIEDANNIPQFIFPVSNISYLIQNEENNFIKITCYDMLGKFMLERSYTESGYLDLETIPSGVYFMYIEYNGKPIKPYKFIVSH